MEETEPMRILIASDIHLGYMEKDAERGEDTFNTFEEILQIAKKKKVDMLLLGGDLFHIQKPSLYTLNRCINLLRKYCMGDDPVQLQVINEPKSTFGHSQDFPWPNFEDQNINVSLPVFSIHGNHDDPSGGRHPLGAVELLHNMGLITYFGKHSDLNHIKLSPVLIQKGQCRLALYGLGAMPDERCHRIFQENKISYILPEDDNTWLKVLVVHQNRHKRQVTKYLPEKFLAGFPDLVVWGHEHEAQKLHWSTECNFYIFQPGSGVITALSPGEDAPKQVGLLEIHGNDGKSEQKFKITTERLKSVRRLYLKDVNIEKDLFPEKGIPDQDSIMVACEGLIDEMIRDADMEHTGLKTQPKLPLIRLRVFFDDPSYTFNTYLFGRRFLGRVANPTDIVKFTRKRMKADDEEDGKDLQEGRARIEEAFDRVAIEEVSINDIIKEYFENEDSKQPDMLPTNLLISSVRNFVEKEATDAIENALEMVYLDMDEAMKSKIESEDTTVDFKREMRDYKERTEKDEKKFEVTLLSQNKPSRSGLSGYTTKKKGSSKKAGGDDDVIELGSDFDSSDEPVSKSTKGRGTRGGRGARGGARGRGGRSKTNRIESDSDSPMDDDDDVPKLKTPASSKRTTPSRAAKSTTKKKFTFSDSESS